MRCTHKDTHATMQNSMHPAMLACSQSPLHQLPGRYRFGVQPTPHMHSTHTQQHAPADAGVLPNRLLIRSQVNAEGLAICHIAMLPLQGSVKGGNAALQVCTWLGCGGGLDRQVGMASGSKSGSFGHV